ncbi:MAG: hypothetical protein NZM25_01995 [Leptospiraceae bacterium]|nr:hypothetical protein [Leptospiraceae bacterium]MDW8306948.1 hypothetical protein [Leptospiraceae bacterium]
MIAAMRQIVFFVPEKEKKLFLRKLQSLGIVDVDWQSLPTRNQTLLQKQEELLALWKKIRKFRNQKQNLPRIKLVASFLLLHEFLSKEWDTYEKLLKALSELQEERKEAALWKNTDPEKYFSLARHGLYLFLYSGSYRFFKKYRFDKIKTLLIRREKDHVYFLVFSEEKNPPKIPFVLHRFPSRSLAEIENDIVFLEEKIKEKEALFAYVSQQEELLARSLAALHNQTQRELTLAKMQHVLENRVIILRGYFPKEKEQSIREFCAQNEFAYAILPASKDAPVLLKNPPPLGLFENITRLFSLPSYQEVDPTPFFAPFFTVFFGLALADAGYGLLLIIASLVLLRHKDWKTIGKLGFILGSATLVAGILLNSFFGKNLFTLGSQAGIFPHGEKIALFAAYTVQGKTVYPALSLALLLGVLQISVALFLQAFNEAHRKGLAFSIRPISFFIILLSLFVLATHSRFLSLGLDPELTVGPWRVGYWLSSIPADLAYFLFGVALLAFLFFHNPSQSILKRPLAALWELYQLATGFLGDFLSYIRLFALALSGGLLGNAFNQIAFMLQESPVWGVSLSVLVLVVGHALNFALSLLGAVVHPLRLTFVEFYKNLGFHGGGRAYEPFRRISYPITQE